MSEFQGPQSAPAPPRLLRRLLMRLGVMVAAAGAVFGAVLASFALNWGFLYFLPPVMVANLVGGGFPVGATISYVVVPLGVVLAYRLPWWVRWAAAGVLVLNVVLLAVYVLPFTTP